MHFLRLLSVAALSLGSLSLSSTARAGGAGDHENNATAHADDAVVTARQSDPGIGPPRDPDARRDPSMFGWGLTMAITGGLSSIAGVVVSTVGMEDAICIRWNDGDCSRQAHGQRLVNAGSALVIAGSVLMGIGIPLAVIGGRRVRGPHADGARAALVPVVGPGHAGTAFTLMF